MEKSKTTSHQTNLDFHLPHDELIKKTTEKIRRNTDIINEYPDVVSLMLDNKTAIKNKKKKDFYGRKQKEK